MPILVNESIIESIVDVLCAEGGHEAAVLLIEAIEDRTGAGTNSDDPQDGSQLTALMTRS